MSNRNLLILGGYGNAGLPLAGLLLAWTEANVILAGRNLEKARAAAQVFNQHFPGDRASAVQVDAANPGSLANALPGVDLLVVASSTAQYADRVVRAALDAGCDYLDVQYSRQKYLTLQRLSSQIEAAGLCFITEGGFHPGLPAVLVRLAGQRLDRLERALVGSVIKIDWARLKFSRATIHEMVAELLDFDTQVFKDGRWQTTSMTSTADFLTMDFGDPFGSQLCAPMFLEEMRPFPEKFPELRQTGFYVGGFNWFVDWLVLPVGYFAMRLWPDLALWPLGRLLEWGLRRFSQPPYGTRLKLESSGWHAGRRARLQVLLSHPDGYWFTAIPVVATLLQVLDGSRRRTGLWTQGNLVDPERLLADMQCMGVDVLIRTE